MVLQVDGEGVDIWSDSSSSSGAARVVGIQTNCGATRGRDVSWTIAVAVLICASNRVMEARGFDQRVLRLMSLVLRCSKSIEKDKSR